MIRTCFLLDNNLCLKNLLILIDHVVNFCAILNTLNGCFDAIFYILYSLFYVDEERLKKRFIN